jgi:hypothetical protein
LGPWPERPPEQGASRPSGSPLHNPRRPPVWASPAQMGALDSSRRMIALMWDGTPPHHPLPWLALAHVTAGLPHQRVKGRGPKDCSAFSFPHSWVPETPKLQVSGSFSPTFCLHRDLYVPKLRALFPAFGFVAPWLLWGSPSCVHSLLGNEVHGLCCSYGRRPDGSEPWGFCPNMQIPRPSPALCRD